MDCNVTYTDHCSADTSVFWTTLFSAGIFFDHKTDVCIYFILAGSYVALTLLGKAPAHVQGSL